MPQINLLSTEGKRSKLPWEVVLTVFVRIAALVFIGILVYYGYLFVRTRSIVQDIDAKQKSIIATQEKILGNKDRRELLVRQGQLQAFDQLVKSRQMWSKLLPELAKATLKSASYISFSASSEGTIQISVLVPTYVQFDQFLQVFDLPEYSEKFTSVKVTGISKYQLGETSGVRFDVDLTYNPIILQDKQDTK